MDVAVEPKASNLSPMLPGETDGLRSNWQEKTPVEILRKIFTSCPRTKLFNLEETPWVLTRVCRRWREVALNDTTLWTDIRIDSQIAETPAFKSLGILKNVVRLAGSQPLHIRLNMAFLRSQPQLQDLCDVIRPCCDRWASLYCYNFNTKAGPPPSLHPTSTQTGFTALKELDVLGLRLHTRLSSSVQSFVESISSASKLRKLAMRSCEVSAFDHLVIAWHWSDITDLRLIDCHFSKPNTFSTILQQARHLHTLALHISRRPQPSSTACTLPSVRVLNVKDNLWGHEGLTLPHLEHLEMEISVKSKEDWLSSVIRLIERSNAQLKEVTIRKLGVVDVRVARFLLTTGSNLKKLTITGMVFDHLFDCMASMLNEFLPELEVLRIRAGYMHESDLWELSPPLDVLAKAVRSRGTLKVLEIDVFVDTPRVLGASLDISEALQDIESLRRRGLTIIIHELDGSCFSGPTLKRLGQYLELELNNFKYDSGERLVENNILFGNLFRLVESFLQKGQLKKEDLRTMPSLHTALSHYAYRKFGDMRDTELPMRERAKTILWQISKIVSGDRASSPANTDRIASRGSRAINSPYELRWTKVNLQRELPPDRCCGNCNPSLAQRLALTSRDDPRLSTFSTDFPLPISRPTDLGSSLSAIPDIRRLCQCQGTTRSEKKLMASTRRKFGTVGNKTPLTMATTSIAGEPKASNFSLLPSEGDGRSNLWQEKTPVEVLQKIFAFCPRWNLFNLEETPWVLTRVCRRWRRVALDDTSLWTDIRIGYEQITEIPALKSLGILENIIRLAGSQPLHIELDFLRGQHLRDVIQASCDRWASLFCYNSGEALVEQPYPDFTQTSFASLEELRFLFLDLHDGVSNSERSLIESISSASKLKKITMTECNISALDDLVIAWHWSNITDLRLIGCDFSKPNTFSTILQQARCLHTLALDISRLPRSSSSVCTLPSVRVLNVGDNLWGHEALTLPHLEHLEIEISLKSEEDWISSVIELVKRSNTQLKEVTIRKLGVVDVRVARFLLTTGSNLKKLTITGMVFDHLFDCMSSMPNEFLPKLETLKIRAGSVHDDPMDRNDQSPWELSPPLDVLAKSLRSREMLKALDMEVFVNTPKVFGAGLDIGEALRDILILREEGLSITIHELDGAHFLGPTLQRLGQLLERELLSNDLRPEERQVIEKQVLFDNIFRVLESFLQKGQLSKESLATIPALRAALTFYAYREFGDTRDTTSTMRERAKKIVGQLDEMASGSSTFCVAP
ncbi:hypothetical protein V5O48_002364 [Marasmius crinis-equi]|uniref:F-box domain-containing protein n=1 Tax=Marasmius crinis-equi TaxID=585013 RepID=A0ABR3FW06_9AGAR